MKYKTSNQIHYSYPLIAFLNNESINNINLVFNTHYTKQTIKTQIIIKRKEQEYGFWDKLIKGNRQARVNEKE